MKKQTFDFCNKAKYFKQLRKCTTCQKNIFGYLMTYHNNDKIRFVEPVVYVDEKTDRITCKTFLKKDKIK